MLEAPGDLRSLRRGRRRWAIAVLATLCASAGMVLAPVPQVVSAREVVVQTEHVRLQVRTGSRAAEPIGPARNSEEGIELRTALEAPQRRTTASPTVATTEVAALGVTSPVAPDGPVLVRGRVQGTWTPWFELAFEPGEAPDRGSDERAPGVHSEPVWLGGADAYELDAPGDVTALDVHLVGEGPLQRRLEVVTPSAGALGAPSIQPRSAWGARPPIEPPSITADLKLAIVHHSVSGNTYSPDQTPSVIRSVQAYHQGVRGYNDIAYNIVVDRFGRAWEGRAGGLTNVGVGGHSQGFNTGSVGVVVLGDYRSATPSAATVETVAKVIAWKFAVHRVDPASTVRYTSGGSAKYAEGVTITLPRVVGHRDVQATDCPGGNLYSRLGTIRARVAQLVPQYQTGVAPVVVAPDTTGDGLVDPIAYRPGGSADAQWVSAPLGLPTRRSVGVRGTYRPATGDLDGNGFDDVVWHGSGSTPDHIWWAGPGGIVSRSVPVGGSYVPVIGDFDGSGTDDVLWYATGLAPDSIWYFRSDRTYEARPLTQDLITGVPVVGDFDGSGTDDVFWYGPGDADDRLWRGNPNRTFKVTAPGVAGRYQPVALDATAAGGDEILWYAAGASRSYRWTFASDGTHSSTSIATPVLLGQPVVGDYDGDGFDDVLIAAPGSAPDAVWYSTPTGIAAQPVSVVGSYAIAAGPMDIGPPHDVLFVSTAAVHLWQGIPTRGFTSTRVG